MKQLFIILLLVLLVASFGCERESVERPGKEGLLRQIKVEDKLQQSFEYDELLLLNEKNYGGFCPDNPIDEFEYTYQHGKLSSIQSTLRSMYSSTSALCDPATGMKSTESFEYDTEGRISKVIRQESYTVFDYNGDNLVEKQTIYTNNGTSTLSTTFRYDAAGNLIEEIDQNGESARYAYDDKPNPFYLINQRPGWISPHNKSPNNVIRATGKYRFERKIIYNKRNLPAQVTEDNTFTYTYIYQ